MPAPAPPVPWPGSADALARILREHGAGPGAVRDVDAAWAAFCGFAQVEVEGVDPPEDDGDGVIVAWGRWSWTGGRPALSFGRQLAVGGAGGEPQLWKAELLLVFADDPAWADAGPPGRQDSGFDFSPVGAARAAALRAARRLVENSPQPAALWRAEPVHSAVTWEQVD